MSNIDEILTEASNLFEMLSLLGEEEKIEALNEIREHLHDLSPFSEEPVDYVKWVRADEVYANDYNPNAVAPPEMELLERSISADGFTQPIVTWPTEEGREVVDGFHRNRVGKESKEVNLRIKGYLPVVGIKSSQEDRNDRMASTIRHNRARGKHKVEAMTEIVLELKRRNWSPKKIGKELGMDQDEVLRLVQISGLTEMFQDADFCEAWEVEDEEDLSSVVEVGGGSAQHVGGRTEPEPVS